MSKKTIIPLNNEGSSTKTTSLKSAIEYVLKLTQDNPSLSMAIFSADKNNKELYNTYGTRTDKGKLLPFEEQKAIDGGVEYLDIRVNDGKLAKALGIKKDFIFLDPPADSVKEFATTYNGQVQTLIDVFKKAKTEVLFLIPIVSKDKSFQSIEAIYSLFKDTPGPYEFLFLLNEGKMENKLAVLEEYKKNPIIEKMKSTFTVHEHTLKTMFNNQETMDFVKNQKLRERVDNDDIEDINTAILVEAFLDETDAIWQERLQ